MKKLLLILLIGCSHPKEIVNYNYPESERFYALKRLTTADMNVMKKCIQVGKRQDAWASGIKFNFGDTLIINDTIFIYLYTSD